MIYSFPQNISGHSSVISLFIHPKSTCMIKTTTQIDLLQYAYNESDLADSDRIQRSIDGDPLVKEAFQEIHQLTSILNDGFLEPSEKSILNILAKA